MDIVLFNMSHDCTKCGLILATNKGFAGRRSISH